jgi:hypothetical protein
MFSSRLYDGDISSVPCVDLKQRYLTRSFLIFTLHWRSNKKTCGAHWKILRACKILAEVSYGKKFLEILGGNTGGSLKEVGYKVASWIQLAQERDQWQIVVNILLKFRFHTTGNFLTSSAPVRFFTKLRICRSIFVKWFWVILRYTIRLQNSIVCDAVITVCDDPSWNSIL